MGSETQNISSLRPFFDGSDYPNWKFKMELYLDCDSTKLSEIILKGWEPPKSTVDRVVTTLPISEWRNEQNEENYKNKKGYDHYSLFHDNRRKCQASTIYFSQENMEDIRKSL